MLINANKLRMWSEKQIVVLMLNSYVYNTQITSSLVALGNVTLLPVEDLYVPSPQVSLGMTWNRMHLFNLTDYSRLIYIDGSSSIMDNLDPLFETETLDSPSFIAAAPKWIPQPNLVWTQFMVVKPNITVFETIMAKRASSTSLYPQDYINSIYTANGAVYFLDAEYGVSQERLVDPTLWNSIKVLFYHLFTPWDQDPSLITDGSSLLQSWLNWRLGSDQYCPISNV
eukprot:gene16868-20057_t